MRQFLRLVMLSYSLFIVLCGGVLIIGRAHPSPDLVPELRKCNGSLCYVGIIPGKTTWNDALILLKNTPGLSFNISTLSARQLPGLLGKMMIMRSSEGTV